MARRITDDEYKTLQAKRGVADDALPQPSAKKANKYHNKIRVVDGIRFDSQAEAKRWAELKLLVAAGTISALQRQVAYPVEIAGQLLFQYVADFVYTEKGKRVVEDVKGVKTPIYRLKKKAVAAAYGVEIQEVRMGK